MAKTPNKNDLRFAVIAADTALFTIRNGTLLVRAIDVNRPPFFVHTLGLPGGIVDAKETAEQAALRHLSDKAGIALEKLYIEQLYTFSALNRDPRGRVVAVAYLALVPWEKLSTEEQTDTATMKWLPAKEAREFAYDHDEIVKMALERLASRITYTTLIGKLMPNEFTLTELEKAYECILRTKLDKRNFRKKILKLKILKPLNKKRVAGRSRPAELYRFSSLSVREIEVI